MRSLLVEGRRNWVLRDYPLCSLGREPALPPMPALFGLQRWLPDLCHYAPSSLWVVADSSRRAHANSLPVGFCSSDASVLLRRATSNSAGAVEPDADGFRLSTDQRPDGNRPVIFSCPHWPPGSAPRQRGPAIFEKSFPTNRNATDRSVLGSWPGQAAHPHYFHIGPHARHAQQHRDLILARSRVTRRCRPTGLRRSAFQWVLHGPDEVCGATLRRRSDVRRYCRPDTGGEAAHSRRGSYLDAARPESDTAREFSNLVDSFLAGQCKEASPWHEVGKDAAT